jgi:alcohol dehydrogenase class IV
MNSFPALINSYSDTRVSMGNDVWPAFHQLLMRDKPRVVAVFTGRRSADISGAWKDLCDHCNSTRLQRFSAISPEPDLECVQHMQTFLQRQKPDWVIAIGGGSVMDAAKAAYLAYQSKKPVHLFFGVNRYSGSNAHKRLKTVICFPLTAGTGSEVTPYANIVDHQAGVKKLISDPAIIPSDAFCVPAYTRTMPAKVLQATGCDALSHLLEGFLNVAADNNDPYSNRRAIAGIKLINDALPKALRGRGGIGQMVVAATLGGMVIRHKPTSLPHLCSFSWYGRIDHGLATVMLLSHCWEYYLDNPAVAERSMMLRDIFPGDTPTAVIASFRDFLRKCGVPRSLREIPGITPALLDQTARSASKNRMKLEGAPCPIGPDESYDVLMEILSRAY